MDMQDKEFDQVFNSKFEDFEMEPSAMVWDNIADELDGKKGKRAIMPYLSIAATVLVLLTAGILFMQKGNTPAQKADKIKLTANHIEPVKPQINKTETQPAVVTKPIDRVATIAKHQTVNALPVNKITMPVTINVDNSVKEPEYTKTDNQQLIAVVTAPASTIINASVPDVQLTPKTIGIVAQAPVERPAVMASAEKQNEAPAKKHGIRSLGGLINVLVAKVDKREDKIIEFSDSDDDDTESNVTGVNLGVIKIKRQ
ncbi:hypothetical protein [Mucilaginibacter sp.]|uniref:hypothetical protein n=1 Tax=Mucilaginibacter sp. TaxID=1882438 RepID=UPI002634230D|nr:hypothetical protein [Mucilaginibacter sp.]